MEMEHQRIQDFYMEKRLSSLPERDRDLDGDVDPANLSKFRQQINQEIHKKKLEKIYGTV